jgi:triosephosphate isomerase
MRKRYFVGNLKMNFLSREEAEQYISVLRRESTGKHFGNVFGIICPPIIYSREFDHLPAPFQKGAQNVFWEKEGAFTGEISPVMLKNDHCDFVIIGHSERRFYEGETDTVVCEKVRAALKHHLIPIVCIGETEKERASGMIDVVLAQQMDAIFGNLSKMQAEKIVLAYEPRWAIGTDRLPTTQEIFQVRIMIRKWLAERLGNATEERISVLYGGSVKASYLGSVSWEAEMYGVLVGRESLFPFEVVKMMLLLGESGNYKSIDSERLV